MRGGAMLCFGSPTMLTFTDLASLQNALPFAPPPPAIRIIHSRQPLTPLPARRSFQSPSPAPLLRFSASSLDPFFSVLSSPPLALRSDSGGDGFDGDEAYKGPRPGTDLVGDWVANNDGLVRSLPIFVGGLSLLAVLLNRAFSNIALVTDGSSSQSRADILTLSLAVTNILAGLVWLSIRPKYISPVVPRGVMCMRVNPNIGDDAFHELQWTWTSLSSITCCRSLVVIYDGKCLLQIGVSAESPNDNTVAMAVDVSTLLQGSLCSNAMGSGKHNMLTNSAENYLANLSLYPGRSELPFLPSNTQEVKISNPTSNRRFDTTLLNQSIFIFGIQTISVILQPLGDRGIAITGGDMIRGFTNLDQAWITLIAEKLDATLSKI